MADPGAAAVRVGPRIRQRGMYVLGEGGGKRGSVVRSPPGAHVTRLGDERRGLPTRPSGAPFQGSIPG